MTDTPYDLRLELSRRYPAQGQDRRIGELRLDSTDPEQALLVRNQLRQALPDLMIEVYSVEESRARIFGVETFPRPAPQPTYDDRTLNLSRAIGALLKANETLRLHTLDATTPTRQECRDIARAMAAFDLDAKFISAAAQDGAMTLTPHELGFTHSTVHRACKNLALTEQRLHEIRADLLKPSFEIFQPNKRLAEAQAMQDAFSLDGGYPISALSLIGYKGDDDHTTDLAAPADAPFKVVVEPHQAFDDVIRWMDDHLDPIYAVNPAPGETRLEGFRSLMMDGRTYCLKPRA